MELISTQIWLVSLPNLKHYTLSSHLLNLKLYACGHFLPNFEMFVSVRIFNNNNKI